MVSLKAAVVREKAGPFRIERVALEGPRDDEVLVEVVATGICHTDLVVRDQYYPVPLPAVLGHEGAGIVRKVGSRVTKVSPGDHVVMTFDSCGECHNCQKGLNGYCSDLYGLNFSGHRRDGSTPYCDEQGHPVSGCFFNQSSFGELAIASPHNLVKVPQDVPLEFLGPLGCGIQTGAGAVINALKPGAGSSIAIFGSGSVGLAAVMAARLVGCTTIIAVDMNQARLDLALELGATHAINAKEQEPVETIKALTAGEGVQYSLECTALPKVLRQAVEALRQTGVCGLIGAAALGTEVQLDMNSILFGRTLRGIIEGDSVPDIFIPQLIELWRQGSFPFDRLISFYPFEEINQAVQDSEQGKVLKAVVRLKG
ncbi:NAD(P)-dependent alcohol dehydrogenase [Pseudomonas sp. BN102]|uniref:NAD(P)-dependent alcohol dehydrogenase n=1 Tax=Pseudomonas sp. BN102 TaxID=2567886 RepID=UPI002455647F|nr:NAD(P)-dependent alcohol dehydrogenase [Pseudomonas sp. BN102]MDH4611569.1 NAD(P)-dependent alcohol dehydrogenase [Pseudomonas sp. BN102]